MREILFRGKRESDGKWIYGLYSDDYVHDTDFPCIAPLRSEHDDGDLSVILETVGQYTGLKDKNGKMIFEGDIVKADDFIFVVKYGKCGGVANADNYGYMGFYLEAFSEATKLNARYGLRNDICYFDDIKVISNIHDNPELLKGE